MIYFDIWISKYICMFEREGVFHIHTSSHPLYIYIYIHTHMYVSMCFSKELEYGAITLTAKIWRCISDASGESPHDLVQFLLCDCDFGADDLHLLLSE